MNEKQIARLRLVCTAVAVLAELLHLSWEHFHGGVVSHHILNRADLPAISNWWGLLLLPALTWFLLGRMRSSAHFGGKRFLSGLTGALLFGIALSGAFASGNENMASYLFMGIGLLALLLPVYRAECVLGFVLGMTFVFGVVLPTVIASIIAGFSALIHRLLCPLLARLWRGYST